MGFVRRRARRRTMLVAGGLAYEAGKRRAPQDEYQDYPEEPEYEDEPQEQEVPPAPPAPAPTAGGSDTDELQRLAELHEAGTLTDDEFAAAKAKVLGI